MMNQDSIKVVSNNNEFPTYLPREVTESKQNQPGSDRCLRGCKEKCLRICKIVDQTGSPIKLTPPKKLEICKQSKGAKRKDVNTCPDFDYINQLQIKLRKLDQDQKAIQIENQRLKHKVKCLTDLLINIKDS